MVTRFLNLHSPWRRFLGICALACFAAGGMGSKAASGPAGEGPETRGTSEVVTNDALAVLFRDIPAATARAEIRVTSPGGTGDISLPLSLAILHGQVRLELDFARLASPSLPPGLGSTVESLGLARWVCLARPGTENVVVISPGLRAYAEVNLLETTGVSTGQARIASTPLGDDRIEGVACAKSRISFKDARGIEQSGTLWTSPQLANFPMRLQLENAGQTVVVSFRQVKLAAPAASGFQVPKDFTRHASLESMIQSTAVGLLGRALGTWFGE